MELAISITSAAIAIFAAATSVVTYQRTVVHDRKKDTLDAYNALQSQAFDELNQIMPKEISEIVKHPTSQKYKELSGYIARIEHFCVGVNQNIYDWETVYALAHGYLDGNQILSRISPLIDRKNKSGVNYYENIHAVLKRMNEKTRAEHPTAGTYTENEKQEGRK